MRKLIIAVLVITACMWAYHFLKSSGAGHGQMQMAAMPVSVAKVIVRQTREWEDFSGHLEAVDHVDIRPRVQGTIDKIYFHDGQMVKKGDVLFTIDPQPYQAALKAAEAAAVYSNAEFQRAKALLPANAISKHDFDQARSSAANTAAALTKARLDLGYTQVKAPVSGRVNRAEVTVGNLVNGGGDAPVLTTIVSLDPIYAEFDVDEQNYVRYMHAAGDNMKKIGVIPVRLGLSGDNDYRYEGHIASLDNALDAKSGTVRARAVFKNPTGALIPGLYAKVQVNGLGTQDIILINERAISTDQNRKIVFVVGADNKVEAREVKLGAVVDNLRVIREGLKDGDTIVVNGIQRARPGAEVAPTVVPMEEAKEGTRG